MSMYHYRNKKNPAMYKYIIAFFLIINSCYGSSPLCSGNLILTLDSGNCCLTPKELIHLTADMSNCTITSWVINYGDGHSVNQTGAVLNASWGFELPGTYQVT